MDQSFGVEVQNLTKCFGEFTAVKNISLQIKPAEFFALLGPSGCGKTTLLKLRKGYDDPLGLPSELIFVDTTDLNKVSQFLGPRYLLMNPANRNGANVKMTEDEFPEAIRETFLCRQMISIMKAIYGLVGFTSAIMCCEASRKLTRGIKGFAESLGATNKFNFTLTATLLAKSNLD
jgi:hypothetical protein